MVMNNDNADDRIVVGYFVNGVDASRAISELLDEGFLAAEIGAAFRTPVSGMEVTEGGRLRGAVAENPATAGSVSGPASHDQAVTPAGLAPGSGNAFPAPSKPGPIPGGELPSTLRHELPHELPSILHPSRPMMDSSPAPVAPAPAYGDSRAEREELRREQMRRTFGESAESQKDRRESSMKFGTGEGHLLLDFEYSEPSFENSFLGMGLSTREARVLSGELGRGGAVVSIAPGSRASLAEAIVERNHGRVRFEGPSTTSQTSEGSRVEIYGRMRNYYRPEEAIRRKAS